LVFVAFTTLAENSSVALTGRVTLARFNSTVTAVLEVVELLLPHPAAAKPNKATHPHHSFQHFLTLASQPAVLPPHHSNLFLCTRSPAAC
jgi:hypothetical protein